MWMKKDRNHAASSLASTCSTTKKITKSQEARQIILLRKKVKWENDDKNVIIRESTTIYSAHAPEDDGLRGQEEQAHRSRKDHCLWAQEEHQET